MEKFRLLSAFFIGTFFYTVMSFIGGSDGIWAMKQLQEQKQVLSAHTAAIEKTYSELSLEQIALQKDLDVIASYAKKLGYVSESEKLVKISGLASRETHIFDPGTVVRHHDVKFIPEWLCKSAAFTIMILSYFVLFLADVQKGLIRFPAGKKCAGGIAVYDMQ
ncbi:septum formation initiator family protein [Treponema sp.]|uniref:septum formation initiator family protein n=1 Tax=Treponema sp. TaxID=166 RepID=UPI003F097655